MERTMKRDLARIHAALFEDKRLRRIVYTRKQLGIELDNGWIASFLLDDRDSDNDVIAIIKGAIANAEEVNFVLPPWPTPSLLRMPK